MGYDYDIGIVGGGAAGLTVAAGAAQLGAKTLLIEKEPLLGGDCLHYGCVPSKTLIKTAKVYHQMKKATEYGLPAVDPPPVDFKAVSARIQSVIGKIQHHDSEERFCGLGARVMYGEPVFKDKHAVDLDGQTLSAKRWVLSTGSSAAAPPLPGLDRVPYLTNRDLFSLEKLPESMIVLGGGPIAMEMAQAFNRLGTRVTVIQRSGQILTKEDKEMADLIQHTLEDEGVVFHLNASIDDIWEAGPKKEVRIKTRDGRQIDLKADRLLVALGRKANVDGLGLDRIGVEFSPKGIQVDNRLRTNHHHIYAAGDVTGQYQFTHAAGYEGGIIVANAIFHLPRKTDYTWLPWCTYTDPELASVGMNEKAAQAQGIQYTVWEEEFADNDRGQAEGAPGGKIKLILNEKERPIGVQILGMHAGDLLSEWVAVLGGKVKLSTLASAIHPYPTLAEINKRVAGKLLSQKIFSEKVKKGLSLIFHLKGRACGEES